MPSTQERLQNLDRFIESAQLMRVAIRQGARFTTEEMLLFMGTIATLAEQLQVEIMRNHRLELERRD